MLLSTFLAFGADLFCVSWANPCVSWISFFFKKSGIGNIIVKCFTRYIDDLVLYETLLCFGEVFSSRVVCDSNGEPKCYDFVHFVHYATLEAAELAIKKVDGMTI